MVLKRCFNDFFKIQIFKKEHKTDLFFLLMEKGPGRRNDRFHGVVEMIPVHHDDVAASQTLDFDVRADADDLKTFGTRDARVALLHFHHVV